MAETPEPDAPRPVDAPTRRGMLGVGTAAVAGLLSGAFGEGVLLNAQPWRVTPALRFQSKLARWDLRQLRPISSEVRWCVDTTRHALALSFDDGPDPEITPIVLDALAAHSARATFFVVGALVQQHESVLRDTHAAGHEIGNHTWTHPSLLEIDPLETEKEIETTSAVIHELTGEQPRWFRPPLGQVTGEAVAAAARNRMDVVLWSQRFGIEEPGDHPRIEELRRAVRTGDFVLSHDGVGASAKDPGSAGEVFKRTTRRTDAVALDSLLTVLRADGWELVTLSELTGGAGAMSA